MEIPTITHTALSHPSHSSDLTEEQIQTSKPSPVSIIDDSLLWRISLIIADLDDEVDSNSAVPAIITLRYTSQVCSAWRKLIIASPSLWARVINLNHLRNRLWRNHVLNRTREAPLFILARATKTWNIESVALSLLDDHWSRIRSLDMEFIRSDQALFNSESRIWPVLKRPTNTLESFKITIPFPSLYPYETVRLSSPPQFSVFGDQAPSLRVYFAPNIRFNLRATWTSHLHYLALNAPVSASELLEALTHMPLLETLKVGDDITHETTTTLPSVTINRLTQIIIYTNSNIGPFMTFLEHLNPIKGFCLDFVFSTAFRYDPHIPETESLMAAANVLSLYSQRSNLEASIKIALTLSGTEFKFEASGADKRLFRFHLKIGLIDVVFPPGTVCNLLTNLSMRKMPDVSHLSLDIVHCDFPLSDPSFTQFMLSTPATVELETDVDNLDPLLQILDGALKYSFRSLQQLEITYLGDDVAQIYSVKKFIHFIINIGAPLSQLIIRWVGFTTVDLTSLEDIIGLKVVIFTRKLGVKEYICGSGKIEELIIEDI